MSRKKHFFTLYEYLLMKKVVSATEEIFFLLFIVKLLICMYGRRNLLSPLKASLLMILQNHLSSAAFTFPLSSLSVE